MLIDGRSGAGKSRLATRVLERSPSVQLVRLDDLYPGWDGLAAGSAHVATHVLHPTEPRWRRWDWATDAPADWVSLDPALPLVVEGCGAISRASRALATFAVWIDALESERRRRALARDGESFAPHWERWAAQERALIAREQPRSLADLVVDGEDESALASAVDAVVSALAGRLSSPSTGS